MCSFVDMLGITYHLDININIMLHEFISLLLLSSWDLV